MTVINNIEIDDIQYERNLTREAITNNEPLEEKLHAVLVISNPRLYARRYILIREMIRRMELEESDVIVYVVELAYKEQKFLITNANNPRHLQIRTAVPLWHKENMVNMAVQNLLPADWKAVAWIDADLAFENATWAKDTLRILNGSKDMVQLFSHAIDMTMNNEAMSIFNSFGYQFMKGNPYSKSSTNFWHPGYAWACTRRAYEQMGGLFEVGILGSGDHIMALSFISKGLHAINDASSEGYKTAVLDFQSKVKTLRLGYTPGLIRHYYHGEKKDRKYNDRWQILVKHDFDPTIHIMRDANGILVPTKECPEQLLTDIMTYFSLRNEDSCYAQPSTKASSVHRKPSGIKMTFGR